MNILVISDKLYPDEYGGSCTVAYKLIEQWQKDNIVDIFTCKKTKTSNDDLFRNKVYRNFIKVNPFFSAKCLKKILKENDYDVIVTHDEYSWFIYYLATLFKKNYYKNKLYNVFHGPWYKEATLKYEGLNSKIKKFFIPKMMYIIDKMYCKRNNNFIFLSRYMQNELALIDNKIKDKNCYFIAGGIDLKIYNRKYTKDEAKSLLNIEKDKCILFTLRRLEKRMGIDNLIEALCLMNETEREKFILIIGGKGGYREALEAKAKPIQGNVVFAGFIPDEEINKYFCAADLFVVPTLDLEGFGLVNLESLAMGVPVLATPQGGMVELASSFKNFKLADENSIDGLRRAILKYSNIYKNKIIKEDLSIYDWSFIAEKYLEILKK